MNSEFDEKNIGLMSFYSIRVCEVVTNKCVDSIHHWVDSYNNPCKLPFPISIAVKQLVSLKLLWKSSSHKNQLLLFSWEIFLQKICFRINQEYNKFVKVVVNFLPITQQPRSIPFSLLSSFFNHIICFTIINYLFKVVIWIVNTSFILIFLQHVFE